MNSKAITVSIITGLLGLVIGFVSANSINRSEITSLRMQAQTAPPADGAPQKPGDFTLDPEELKAKIESLLPGATSAGLASAFGTRRPGSTSHSGFGSGRLSRR